MTRLTQNINNYINKVQEFVSRERIFVKYISLFLITTTALFLTLLKYNTFDFGIIALICWIFAFLDLARIKFRDFEIDFMTHQQAITEDERKLFMDNYNLMEKFTFEFRKSNKIDATVLEYISKATQMAYLCLSKKLATQLDKYLTTATRVYFLDKKIETTEQKGKNPSEYMIEKNKYLDELYSINLVELYRPYVKVKTNAEE